MWDNYIGRQIRRCNRNLLIVNGVLIGSIIFYVCVNARYLANFVSGAKDISAGELAALSDPNTLFRFFVRVHGQKAIDTGIQSVEQTINEDTNQVESTSVEAEYRVLLIGKKLLVVKANPTATSTFFVGALEPLPSDVYREVVSPVIRQDADLQNAFIPAMLNANDYAEQGWWTLGICIPILLLAGWNLWKWKKRVSDYGVNPLYRRLRCFGSPESIAEQIETCVRMNSPQQTGNACLCGPWLLKPEYFSLRLFHLPDIVWVHEKVTRHSINFIPTGKSYAACLYDRYGYSSEVQSTKANVESLMGLIVRQCPWVVAGFNGDLKKLWQSQKETFISAVDERRMQFAGASTESK